MLYGPPGTGKTHLARVIAAESSRSLICASPMDLKGGYIGQTGHNVRELFARARKHSPCILFIDEIDAIAPARSSAYSDHSTEEIVMELLIHMDGVRAEGDVFLLGATLYPQRIDLALMSRITYKIEIPNLDVHERQRLFTMLLRKMQANFDFDVDAMAAELAVKSANINGRGIRNLVNHAAEVAVTPALNEGRINRIELTRQDLLSEIDLAR